MPEAISLKQHLAVRRVIDALRGKRPLRQVISRVSELNLRMLAEVKPQQTRDILKNLLFLEQMEGAPQGLSVPDGLYAHLNREILRRAATDLNFLLSLRNEKGIIDFSKAGIRRKLGYIDLTPNIKKPSLSEQLETIGRAREAIKAADKAGDHELGDLMLYETLLNASIELFRIGENRSWAKRSGEMEALEQFHRQMLDLAGKLDALIEIFPFGAAGYREMAKEKIEIARDMVFKMNNPAGSSTLTGLIRKISEILDGHENARVQRQKSALEHGRPSRKIRITDETRGKFEVTRTFYELDENGVMRRVYKDVPFDCARDLIRSFEHEKESIEAEKEKVQALVDELQEISEHPLENYPELLEYSLGRKGLAWEKDITRDYYSALRDMRKRKALLVLWGAEQLVRIPDDQARALAGSLIRVAAKDYEKRVEVLEAELEAVPRQQAYAEELIGALVVKLVKRWTTFLLKYTNFNLKQVKLIQERLGKYFSTFFKVDMEKENPDWIRQERSALVGLLAIFRPYKTTLSQGQKLTRRLEEIDREIRQPGAARASLIMEKRTINGQLRVLGEKLRAEGYFEAGLKAAQQMLLLEFNFLNRDRKMNSKERKAALRSFYAEKAKVYGERIVPAYLS